MSVISTRVLSRATGAALAAFLVLGGSLNAVAAASATTGTATDQPIEVVEPELSSLTPGVPSISGTPRFGDTLFVNVGEWPDAPALNVQWLADDVLINGAVSDSLRLTAAELGKRISVRVTGTKSGFVPAEALSEPTAPVVKASFAATSVTIAGTAAVGLTVAASTANWEPEARLGYQWFSDGAVIAGATASKLTLTAAHRDKRISVKVTGVLEGFTTKTVSSAATGKVITAPTPSVSGSAVVGSTLTAKANTWTTGATLTYQWYANSTAISGATKPTYVVASALSGQKVTVRVTGKKSGYATATMTSSSTAYVMRASTPSISGTVAYGATLTAKPNTWTPGSTFSYQWYADGKAVNGATTSTFKLGGSQTAKQISVTVTGKKSGHPTVAKTSARTAKVLVAGTPTISGASAVGSTLTAKVGTWTASTTFGYQWYANGTPIAGATKPTLTLNSGFAGKQITVKVTGKRSGYATVAKVSGKTAAVMSPGTPTISGSPVVTKTLSARTGTWTSGTTFAYQWYVNGSAVKGATRSTLTVSSSYAGKTITVKVIGSKSGFQTVSKVSKPTAKVGYPNRTAPSSSWNCPAWAPIKGNASSMIYHMKGQRFYERTNPEECFRSETAAKNAGYRKAKV